MVNPWHGHSNSMLRLPGEDQIENENLEARLPPIFRVSVAKFVALVCNLHYLMHHIWKLRFVHLTFANIATELRKMRN